MTSDSQNDTISSGVEGLDAILKGGFPRGEVHQIEGGPGTGKTTLALQYLLAGRRLNERGLYMTLSQTERSLGRIARSHGWSLDGISVRELPPGGSPDRAAKRQTVLHTSDVELDELMRQIAEIIEQTQPQRLVIDTVNVIGLLSGGGSQYRLEIVGLHGFLLSRSCTTLLISEAPMDPRVTTHTRDFQNLASVVVELEQRTPEYGDVKRQLRVVKARGLAVHGGNHHFRIESGGLQVFPRLGPPPQEEYTQFTPVPSGIRTLDALLGGGLELGTTCLLVGSPGTGKSTLAAVYARAMAARGDHAAIFLFDERPETFKARAAGLGVDLAPHLQAQRIAIHQLDPADLSASEFGQRVRREVVDFKARLVVIDSIIGYFTAMGDATMLIPQLHELITFASRHGALTLLLAAQQGLTSIGPHASVDVSYLSDSVIMLRMFELDGQVRRCLAAIKKRQGEHETSIRELTIGPGGVALSAQPIRGLRKILSGDPEPISHVER
jgi:circadian clock protein KaiC